MRSRVSRLGLAQDAKPEAILYDFKNPVLSLAGTADFQFKSIRVLHENRGELSRCVMVLAQDLRALFAEFPGGLFDVVSHVTIVVDTGFGGGLHQLDAWRAGDYGGGPSLVL